MCLERCFVDKLADTSLDMRAHASVDQSEDVFVDTLVDMFADAFVDMLVDVFVDACLDISLDTCVHSRYLRPGGLLPAATQRQRVAARASAAEPSCGLRGR